MSAAPSEVVNLRVSSAKKALIDRAATVLGESRTCFIVEASVERAETVLADRTKFALSEEQMRRFHKALNAPLPDPDALRRLLIRKSPWEE